MALIVAAIVLGFFALRPPPAAVPPSAVPAVTPRDHVLAAGAGYFVALDDQGRVFGWGGTPMRNGPSRLSTAQRPRVLLQGSWFRRVSAGRRAIYALDARGQLWRAALRDVVDSPTSPIAPTAVFVDRTWKLAIETWGMGVGIGRNGKLWYWSDDQLRAHLDGRSAPDATLRTPRQLMMGTRFVDACLQGARLHAVDEHGRLWRSKDLQRMPTGTDPLQGLRTELDPLSADGNLRRVFCRENAGHVLALDDRGRLFGYGLNLFGEMGLGKPDFRADRSARQSTQLLKLSDRTWIALAVGPALTLGITQDGSLWGWGRNLGRGINLGDSHSRDVPTLIDQTRPWVAVAATQATGVALSADGELVAWGSNHHGALGDGGIALSHDRPRPVLTSIRFGSSNGRR